jgi:hypothetical protein
MVQPIWPTSIREINDLPDDDKHAIYRSLLPEWLFSRYGVDRKSLRLAVEEYPVVTFRCPPGSRAMELVVKRRAADLDAMMYLNMADTFNYQLLVLLVVVNDPDAPRFNTDVDEHGNRTHFGTAGRNVVAEKEALKAGLAPGQIRKGLRVFKDSVPIFEQFVTNMGHDMFLIEPLAYHNAIIFERYGFNYLRGRKDMIEIDRGFRPGGTLRAALSPDNSFRLPHFANTVRGRSWAIHDGILDHPFTGFQMYKRIGHDAGVNTFPDSRW